MLGQGVLEFFIIIATFVDMSTLPLLKPAIQTIRDENGVGNTREAFRPSRIFGALNFYIKDEAARGESDAK